MRDMRSREEESMLQGVIFDMDGLMFDTEPLWESCWTSVLNRYGYEVPAGMFDGVRGLSGDVMCAALRRIFGDDAPAEAIWADVRAMASEALCKGAPKKPGLDDLIEYLRGLMLPLAVASASSKQVIQNNLRQANILQHFDVVLSGEGFVRGKPDPQIFLESARLLGTDPGRTLVLEDSSNGVEAGVAGGFVTVMVPDLTEPTSHLRELATAVVGDLGQVIDLMEDKILG